MKAMLVVVAMLLTGCASLMQPTTGMTAEEMTAAAKDKNASAICSRIIGAWGTAQTVSVNLDKAVWRTGSATVKPDCSVEINSSDPVTAPTPRAPTPGCAGESLVRGADGSCAVVQRDAECRINSVRSVPVEQCAGLRP